MLWRLAREYLNIYCSHYHALTLSNNIRRILLVQNSSTIYRSRLLPFKKKSGVSECDHKMYNNGF